MGYVIEWQAQGTWNPDVWYRSNSLMRDGTHLNTYVFLSRRKARRKARRQENRYLRYRARELSPLEAGNDLGSVAVRT